METTQTSCWLDVADALSAGLDRILLYGPPGTGKTYAALHYGVDEPAERLTCTEDMTSGDVMGTWMPSAERWRFHEGPAIRAWRGSQGLGARLVVDEVDHASGDALSVLLAVTDSLESQRWRNPASLEWVVPGPQFSVVLTCNIESVAELPSSLVDRFPVAIRIDQPHPNALVRLSDDLRGPALQASLAPSDRRLSIRQFYAFDTLRQRVGTERAAGLVFGESASAVLDALAIAAL
jgi:MoxR-like ATPase